MANMEGLRRVRGPLKQGGANKRNDVEDEGNTQLRRWLRRLLLLPNMGVMISLTWGSAFKIGALLLLLAALFTACISLPIEQILKDFLLWIKQDLGPWGPVVLIIAYVPLTVLAIPASILTLGGGYLFGLPIGLVADSVGSTSGATAAFLIGRTFGRSFVISKLKDYPKFQAIAVAIQKSGFKIIFLLRLVPLLPFNILNYLLSVTPVHTGIYMLASWLGMMPSTFSLVYVGTTMKDLSDVTQGWNEISTTRWIFMALGFVMSVILMVYVAKVAKASLDKALIENAEKPIMSHSVLPVVAEYPLEQRPLTRKTTSHKRNAMRLDRIGLPEICEVLALALIFSQRHGHHHVQTTALQQLACC